MVVPLSNVAVAERRAGNLFSKTVPTVRRAVLGGRNCQRGEAFVFSTVRYFALPMLRRLAFLRRTIATYNAN